MKQAEGSGQPFSFILLDEHLSGLETLALEIRAFNPTPRVLLLRQTGWPGESLGQLLSHDSTSVSKPVQESDLLAALIELSKPEFHQSPEPTRPSPGMKQPLHLLLAEDNEVNQKLGVAILKKQGHSVVVARNGREAVEAVEREAFDAVLMDVQMPEMSGLEAARAIRDLELAGRLATGRKRSRRQPLPIIAITAHAMTGDRERCLEAGMNSYLSKPIQPDLLLKTLDELVLCASGSRATQDRVSALGLVERESPTVLPEAPVYYDRDSALRRIGGDQSLLWDLMDLFVEDCPKQLNRGCSAARGSHNAAQLRSRTEGNNRPFLGGTSLEGSRTPGRSCKGGDPLAIHEGIAKLEDELDLLKETFRQATSERATNRA